MNAQKVNFSIFSHAIPFPHSVSFAQQNNMLFAPAAFKMQHHYNVCVFNDEKASEMCFIVPSE